MMCCNHNLNSKTLSTHSYRNKSLDFLNMDLNNQFSSVLAISADLEERRSNKAEKKVGNVHLLKTKIPENGLGHGF